MQTLTQILYWVLGGVGLLGLLALPFIYYHKFGGFRLPGQHGARAGANAALRFAQGEDARNALLGLVVLTFLVIFIPRAAPGWYAYWEAHGIPTWLIYLYGAIVGLTAILGSGSPRTYALRALITLGVIALVWSAGLTTFDYLFGSPQERAVAKAAEEQKEAQARAQREAAAREAEARRVPQLGTPVGSQGQGVDCSRREVVYTFGRAWAPYPGRDCSTRFVYMPGQCVYYKGASGREDGPYGQCTGSKGFTPSVVDVVEAKSAGEPFSVVLTINTRTFQNVFR